MVSVRPDDPAVEEVDEVDGSLQMILSVLGTRCRSGGRGYDQTSSSALRGAMGTSARVTGAGMVLVDRWYTDRRDAVRYFRE